MCVEAELRRLAIERANTTEGLARLVALLLQQPRVGETTEGRKFLMALQTYVRLKRQRARWYRESDDLGFYSRHRDCRPPSDSEVQIARIYKNALLRGLCELFGDEEALSYQRAFGHDISSHAAEICMMVIPTR